MATGIDYLDESWNIVAGCSKISPGCTNCYAARVCGTRLKHTKWYEGLATPTGEWTGEVRCFPQRLQQPLRWRKPRRIGVSFMGDLFHPDVPLNFLKQAFDVMHQASQHTFMVLTKRPDNMYAFLNLHRIGELASHSPNVWLGVTAENQETARERVPKLLACSATVKFVSVEPCLGPVDLQQMRHYGDAGTLLFPLAGEFTTEGRNEPLPIDGGGISWVLLGGESGPNARPMHPEWVRSMIVQCTIAKVPVWFKQWGEWKPGRFQGYDPEQYHQFPDMSVATRVGKKAAGNTIAGKVYTQTPKPRVQS